MILINVLFLELNQSYDFKTEENAQIGRVIEEMVEMIAQKEQLSVEKDRGFFLLCRPETQEVFNPSQSLAELGVCSGDTLLLV